MSLGYYGDIKFVAPGTSFMQVKVRSFARLPTGFELHGRRLGDFSQVYYD